MHLIVCGCSSMAELQLPKLVAWVRFPSSAPAKSPGPEMEKTGVFLCQKKLRRFPFYGIINLTELSDN